MVKLRPLNLRVTKDTGKDSLTQQSFAKDCDINCIIARHLKSGTLDQLLEIKNSMNELYADFSNLDDYKYCLDKVSTVDSIFDSLPASFRDHFLNDPANFASYVSSNDFTFEKFQEDLASHFSYQSAGKGQPALSTENKEDLVTKTESDPSQENSSKDV